MLANDEVSLVRSFGDVLTFIFSFTFYLMVLFEIKTWELELLSQKPLDSKVSIAFRRLFSNIRIFGFQY